MGLECVCRNCTWRCIPQLCHPETKLLVDFPADYVTDLQRVIGNIPTKIDVHPYSVTKMEPSKSVWFPGIVSHDYTADVRMVSYGGFHQWGYPK